MPPVMTSTDAPTERNVRSKTASPPVGLREILRGVGGACAGFVVTWCSRARPAPPWAETRAAWGAHPNGSAESGEVDANNPMPLGESPACAGDCGAFGPRAASISRLPDTLMTLG